MSKDENVRKLSKGFQYFQEIRDEKCVYVDKTDLVWEIANGDKYNFLSRPRRFGKSLLTSTLQCYFEGRYDLFNGLKIMEKEEEWPKRAVFQFDFSGKYTAKKLENYLRETIAQYEEIYGKSSFTNTDDRFKDLMQKACEQTGHKVAVLVDEYDSPLQDTLFDDKVHKEIADVYRGFFPVMKSGGDYLQCLFLTGITKFTQLSLFSINNSVTILSTRPEYATVCGITQQEIIDNYMPELEVMAKINGWTVEQTLAELKEMYDGYRFSSDVNKEVYNPFSLINAFAEKELSNYWAASGASKMLNEMLIRTDERGENLEDRTITAKKLNSADITKDDTTLFLYQTGYLTIKDAFKGGYTLGIPNREVRETIYEILLPNVIKKEPETVDSSISNMKKNLERGDIEKMMESLKLLIAQTPYSVRKEEHIYEERFQYCVSCALYLCGCIVQPEVQVANGRIDIVAHYNNIIFVIELKLDSNGGLEAAKKQLIEKNYTSAFPKDKEVYAIAISFSTEEGSRGISGYDVSKV